MSRTISLSVDVEDDATLPVVLEVLSRHAAGLIMEGFDVRVFAYTSEPGGPDDLEELHWEEDLS